MNINFHNLTSDRDKPNLKSPIDKWETNSCKTQDNQHLLLSDLPSQNFEIIDEVDDCEELQIDIE